MPTIGNEEFPYTDEGMADAEMAAAGIDPMMQQEAGMGLGGEESPMPMTMEEGEDAGRGGDVLLAHMTPGEVVIPAEIANSPEVRPMLEELFASIETDIGMYTVGDPMNNINPETGHPEFGFGSFFKKVKRKVTSPFKKAKKYVTGERQMEKEQKYYEQQARSQTIESRRLMAEQQKFFKTQMETFQATQAQETALFNKQIAEEQQEARVRDIRASRKFSANLFGIQAKNTGVSRDASDAGSIKDAKTFSAPKFYGSNRTTKATPKFKNRPSSGSSSSTRPR